MGGGAIPGLPTGAGQRRVQGAEAELRLRLARQDRGFDPVSIYAGVASPVYDASGNYMIPALNGEIAPTDAARKIRDDLQALTK